jgi:5-bromo-4-chloroindolyl phosphate hydrolysis protein
MGFSRQNENWLNTTCISKTLQELPQWLIGNIYGKVKSKENLVEKYIKMNKNIKKTENILKKFSVELVTKNSK